MALPLPLRPVLAWKTHVIAVRDVPAGQALGYNGAYKTTAPARIATVSVGYGDGLSRRLFGNGEVLLRGQRAPIRGRISMDLTLVDVTHIAGAAIGDEVTLIGRSGAQEITAHDLARWEGTVVYETLCNLTKRVPRRYVE
jgi:alanine racemase